MLYFNFSNDSKIINLLLRKNLKTFSLLFFPLIIISFIYVSIKEDIFEKSVIYKNRQDSSLSIKNKDIIEILKKTHSQYISSKLFSEDPVVKDFNEWFNTNIKIDTVIGFRKKEDQYIQIFYRNNSEKNINNILNDFDSNLNVFLIKKIDLAKQKKIALTKVDLAKQNFLERSKKLIEFKTKYQIDNYINFDLLDFDNSFRSKIKGDEKKLMLSNDQIKILSEYNLLFLDTFNAAAIYSDISRDINEKKINSLFEKEKLKTKENQLITNSLSNSENQNPIFSEVLFTDLINITNKKLLFLVLFSQSFFISLLFAYIRLFNFTKIDNNISFKLFSRNKLLKTFQISKNSLWKSIFLSLLRNNNISQDDKFGIFLMIKNDSKELNEFIIFITENFPNYDLKFTQDVNELEDTSKVIILYVQNQLTPSQIRVKENILDDLSLDIVGSIFFDDKFD